MGFLRWEPLPSRHESRRIPFPLPAAGVTFRGAGARGPKLQAPRLLRSPWKHSESSSGQRFAARAACADALWGHQPPVPGCQAPCCKQGRTDSSSLPSFLAQEVPALSAGESQHRGERLRDPRCTGKPIPGQAAPAAANIKGWAGAGGLGSQPSQELGGNMQTRVSQGSGGN